MYLGELQLALFTGRIQIKALTRVPLHRVFDLDFTSLFGKSKSLVIPKGVLWSPTRTIFIHYRAVILLKFCEIIG